MIQRWKIGISILPWLLGGFLGAWTGTSHAATANDAPPIETADEEGSYNDEEASASLSSIVSIGGVQFDLEGAVALGSGCPGGEVDLSPIPGGLRISFPTQNLSLPAGHPRLSALGACSVSIPMEIEENHYVRSIVQRLRYTVSKNASASGAASSRVRWHAMPAKLLTLPVPYGANLVNHRMEVVGTTQFERLSSCRPWTQTERGLLTITVAFSAQKTSANAFINMSAPELHVYVASASCS